MYLMRRYSVQARAQYADRAQSPRTLLESRGLAMNGISVALLILSLVHLSDGIWIHTKANLAQHLIANAWQQTRADDVTVKPWPWADTWPVARLQYLGKQPRDYFVLAGAQGNSLAFGPGHLYGSELPGTTGVSIVGGHRDTHFAFLKHVQMGDRFKVTPLQGDSQTYIVTAAKAVNSLSEPLLGMPYSSQLILVTCYPFDAIKPGPLRYVVRAEIEKDILL